MQLQHFERLSDWWHKTHLPGHALASLDEGAAPSLRNIASQRGCSMLTGSILDACDYGEQLTQELQRFSGTDKISLLLYSGKTDRFSILALLSRLKPFLANGAHLLVDNADFAGVYEGIRECLMGEPAYRFHALVLAKEDGTRPGQGLAQLTFDRDRSTTQITANIPVNKNRTLGDNFAPAQPVHALDAARVRTEAAVASWLPSSRERAEEIHHTLEREFPDGASPKTYWHEASDKGFTQYFTWGHDQDFGFGFTRNGAMGTRHLEIISESLAYDYLPQDLHGMEVLDIGCWSGGDVIALAGLGARVTALEEHPVSALAAKKLCDLLGVPATVFQRSLYDENPEWCNRFDIVYISGVIYHVTDPVLALRICFAYLKPGGKVVLETKASKLDGAFCEYSGTLEKGWNWYAPSLETMGRWLVDAGFDQSAVKVHMRPIGRLLACAVKTKPSVLPETAGFSRPGSWLERSC